MCRRRNYLVQVGTSGDGDYRDSATGVMVVWLQSLVRQVYSKNCRSAWVRTARELSEWQNARRGFGVPDAECQGLGLTRAGCRATAACMAALTMAGSAAGTDSDVEVQGG